MLEAITLGVVTARDDATITYSYRSRCNYTQAGLVGKPCVLYSPTRQSKRARRLNTTRRLGIEISEPESSSKAGYSTCKSVSVEHTHIIKQ